MHTLLKVLSTGSDLYYRYIIRGTTPGRVSIGGNDITTTPGSPRTKTDHNWAKQCCNLSIEQDLLAFVMHQLHMGPFLYSLTFNNSRNTYLIQIRAPTHNSLYLLQYNQRVWTGHTTIYTHNVRRGFSAPIYLVLYINASKERCRPVRGLSFPISTKIYTTRIQRNWKPNAPRPSPEG